MCVNYFPLLYLLTNNKFLSYLRFYPFILSFVHSFSHLFFLFRFHIGKIITRTKIKKHTHTSFQFCYKLYLIQEKGSVDLWRDKKKNRNEVAFCICFFVFLLFLCEYEFLNFLVIRHTQLTYYKNKPWRKEFPRCIIFCIFVVVFQF